jgi:eukaryotic-like serine/threonine-protein kinase
MPLNPGTRLGNYEIVAPLGAGGMGEVYRSRDPRLNRDVAIKVLSAEMSRDATALARFEREAMSVARLSHPNILSIFEFVHDRDNAFVVTELLEGETLRARLAGGPLPARRAVAYALQIARGMAAAHARGIVHRDLKPENVMITRDDHVKILDFGLAKPVETTSMDKTLATGVATAAGIVLGTFGYMAPEQVRGLEVDHRADMFAFGAVLYEMLSGERAFRGETAADTMSAILTKDPPDLDIARLSISLGLERIVRRCLEKSPDLRFQSANDLAFALETLTTASTSTQASIAVEAAAPPRSRARWLPWAVAVAALAAAAMIAVVAASNPVSRSILFGRTPEPEPRWSAFTRLTETAGEETTPTLSPDGTTVAYAMRVNNSWDIYAQRVGGRNATPIVNDPQRDEKGAAFSPDGSQIAFHVSDATGGIFIAGATGESVRRVTDTGFDPAWSPDGTQIAYGTEEIENPASRLGESAVYVVSVSGGSPRKLVDGDAVQPSWSPSGSHIVYWSNVGGQRDIFTVASTGGTPGEPVTDAVYVLVSPKSDAVVFMSGSAQEMYLAPLTSTISTPTKLPGNELNGEYLGATAWSQDGTRLAGTFATKSGRPGGVGVYDLAARKATKVSTDETYGVVWLADSRRVAYFTENPVQLVVLDTVTRARSVVDVRLPGPTLREVFAISPDNRTIYYGAARAEADIWIVERK